MVFVRPSPAFSRENGLVLISKMISTPLVLFVLAVINGVILFAVPGLREAAMANMVLSLIPVAGPALAGFLALKGRPAPSAVALPAEIPKPALPEPAAKAPALAPVSPAAGLRFLAALQEEARLIDFIKEDISSYSDEQVGSAVRGIHAQLRKALDDRMLLEPVLGGEEGDPVTVPSGFDPAAIRVTGNPKGQPPFKGVLRHSGWRARNPKLPIPAEGVDPNILAPAEVEVG